MIERIKSCGRRRKRRSRRRPPARRWRSCACATSGARPSCPQMLRGVAELEPERRGEVGSAANQARQALEALIEARAAQLRGAELEVRLADDRVDVTLPGTPPQPIGRMHVLTATTRELEDIFLGLGFTVMEGPEVETVHYNFDALNHSPTHPARARTDTFYIADPGAAMSSLTAGTSPRANEELVLRTHTSPMQVRAMEAHPPPLYVVIPGRVYRPDSDATHTPQFHQVEGLAVDEDITLADLKGTLLAFARAVFGDERDVRLRPHFFPFTEPSVEVDVSCFHCEGKGFLRDGARCHLCKGEGWLEVLGAGEVDPNVYSYVETTPSATPPDMTRRRCRGSRGGWASSGSRCSSTASPTCGSTSKMTCASWSSSDEGPAGMAARILRSRARCEGDRGAVDDDRDEGRGGSPPRRGQPRALRVGTRAGGRASSGRRPAEGVHGRPRRRQGEGPARIVCGAPNVAAGQTVAVARPGAIMPDGSELKQAKLRGVVSEGMILAEDELAIGAGGRGDPRAERADLRLGARPRHAARRRAADRHGGARAGDHAQPARLPGGVRGGARAARRDRGAAVRAAVGGGPGERRSDRGAGATRGDRRVPRTCARASRRACSRTSRSGSPHRG